MRVLGIPIPRVDAATIDRLVAENIHEDADVEFKRELPASTDRGRLEFIKDVTSFANTRGGAIICGVPATDGVATAVLGLGASNMDAEILRLEQILATGAQPQVVGMVMKRVPHSNGPILVVGIPNSLSSPHMVSAQHSGQFWARNNAGKYLMASSSPAAVQG